MKLLKIITFLLIFITSLSFARIDHSELTGKEFMHSLKASGNEAILALLYAQAVYDSYSNDPKYCFPEVLDGDNFIEEMNVWSIDHINELDEEADDVLIKFALKNYSCDKKAAN